MSSSPHHNEKHQGKGGSSSSSPYTEDPLKQNLSITDSSDSRNSSSFQQPYWPHPSSSNMTTAAKINGKNSAPNLQDTPCGEDDSNLLLTLPPPRALVRKPTDDTSSNDDDEEGDAATSTPKKKRKKQSPGTSRSPTTVGVSPSNNNKNPHIITTKCAVQETIETVHSIVHGAFSSLVSSFPSSSSRDKPKSCMKGCPGRDNNNNNNYSSSDGSNNNNNINDANGRSISPSKKCVKFNCKGDKFADPSSSLQTLAASPDHHDNNDKNNNSIKTNSQPTYTAMVCTTTSCTSVPVINSSSAAASSSSLNTSGSENNTGTPSSSSSQHHQHQQQQKRKPFSFLEMFVCKTGLCAAVSGSSNNKKSGMIAAGSNSDSSGSQQNTPPSATHFDGSTAFANTIEQFVTSNGVENNKQSQQVHQKPFSMMKQKTFTPSSTSPTSLSAPPFPSTVVSENAPSVSLMISSGTGRHDSCSIDGFQPATAETNTTALLTRLENEEDYERVCLENECLFALQQLVEIYKREASEIHRDSFWDPMNNGTPTEKQIENMSLFIYKKMSSVCHQQFRALFPRGVKHLTPGACSQRVYAYLLIDIVLADDQMDSIAMPMLPGVRLCAKNCPPVRLPWLYALLSFKTTKLHWANHPERLEELRKRVRGIGEAAGDKDDTMIFEDPVSWAICSLRHVTRIQGCLPHFVRRQDTFYQELAKMEKQIDKNMCLCDDKHPIIHHHHPSSNNHNNHNASVTSMPVSPTTTNTTSAVTSNTNKNSKSLNNTVSSAFASRLPENNDDAAIISEDSNERSGQLIHSNFDLAGSNTNDNNASSNHLNTSTMMENNNNNNDNNENYDDSNTTNINNNNSAIRSGMTSLACLMRKTPRNASSRLRSRRASLQPNGELPNVNSIPTTSALEDPTQKLIDDQRLVVVDEQNNIQGAATGNHLNEFVQMTELALRGKIDDGEYHQSQNHQQRDANGNKIVSRQSSSNTTATTADGSYLLSGGSDSTKTFDETSSSTTSPLNQQYQGSDSSLNIAAALDNKLSKQKKLEKEEATQSDRRQALRRKSDSHHQQKQQSSTSSSKHHHHNNNEEPDEEMLLLVTREKIGSGATGDVFSATCMNTGRLLALKEMHIRDVSRHGARQEQYGGNVVHPRDDPHHHHHRSSRHQHDHKNQTKKKSPITSSSDENNNNNSLEQPDPNRSFEGPDPEPHLARNTMSGRFSELNRSFSDITSSLDDDDDTFTSDADDFDEYDADNNGGMKQDTSGGLDTDYYERNGAVVGGDFSDHPLAAASSPDKTKTQTQQRSRSSASSSSTDSEVLQEGDAVELVGSPNKDCSPSNTTSTTTTTTTTTNSVSSPQPASSSSPLLYNKRHSSSASGFAAASNNTSNTNTNIANTTRRRQKSDSFASNCSSNLNNTQNSATFMAITRDVIEAEFRQKNSTSCGECEDCVKEKKALEVAHMKKKQEEQKQEQQQAGTIFGSAVEQTTTATTPLTHASSGRTLDSVASTAVPTQQHQNQGAEEVNSNRAHSTAGGEKSSAAASSGEDDGSSVATSQKQVSTDVFEPKKQEEHVEQQQHNNHHHHNHHHQQHQLQPIITEEEQRIVDEISTLKRMRHENIISYYGARWDRSRGIVYIAMELANRSLRQMIENTQVNLPLRLIAVYARGILQGLAYLHENHIIHRDIKSANILVTDSGVIKVSDFGLSVCVDVDESSAATHDNDNEEGGQDNNDQQYVDSYGSPISKKQQQQPRYSQAQMKRLRQMCGTPQFLSPEIFTGALPSEQSDMWSFGCTMIELVSGNAPWWNYESNSLWEIYARLKRGETPVLPFEERTDITPEFADFVESCLQIDALKRPTAKELLSHPFLCVLKRTVSNDF